jgi:hypothetical protein
VRVLRHLPDQGLAIALRHPVPRLDAVIGGDRGVELLLQFGLVRCGPFQGGRGHLVPSRCDGDRSLTDRMVGNQSARTDPAAQARSERSAGGS